ncbi:hypothetical protein [Thermococcus sp.]|uniref:hypothetical protein n=1 Tax=Thermococcus sp. TaxID=35749 RepID=UPI002636686A|nr:hypothetical protein [Thermococcus sp.]
MLVETYKRFRIAKNGEKAKLANHLIREVAKLSHEEPFWEAVKKLGLKPEAVKEAMLYLEGRGEIEIKRSSDGKRLWVLTLRDIRKNPVRLDRWLGLTSGRRAEK